MSAARVFVLPPRQRPLLKNFCDRSLRSDSQISVAFGDDLTVLADLNGVAIENGYETQRSNAGLVGSSSIVTRI